MPRAAMAPNQISITGPNMAPTPAVPRRWMMNRPAMMAAEMGTTYGLRAGVGALVGPGGLSRFGAGGALGTGGILMGAAAVAAGSTSPPGEFCRGSGFA